MGREIKVSVSMLCADFTKLKEEVQKCESAGVDTLHIDVMDGHFVPIITTGPLMVKALRPLTKLPIEAHLMVEHPNAYIDQFLDAGSDCIYLHVECYGPLREASRGFGKFPKEVDTIEPDKIRQDIVKIKRRNKKVYVVINPGTPACINPILEDIDGVLIMSVNPGFSGQKFMPEVLAKLKAIRAKFDGDIAIDGGINDQTAPQAVGAGANILATASYFFSAKNPKKLVSDLKALSKIQAS